MYNVHMRRYTTAQARRRFAELLNAAERGQSILIERRGVRFVLQSQRARSRRPVPPKSIIAHLDPAIASGQWTWTWDAGGLQFTARRRPR